ncbi:MAG: hypothetical protein ABI891_11545 [Acidobacteriota bacterium]
MFTKKIITLFVITLFAFIGGVSEINAQALKIGSVVNLQNQYPTENGYLDTRGRVKDKSQFRTATTETTFVSTNVNPNRDNGSGSWKIVSATGKADGSPLLYGDKIHLMNMYPGAGYLDSYGFIKDMPAFASYVSGGSKIGVFTTQSKNRDSGSGTWIVKSASSKADGTPVNGSDTIHLQNGYPNSGYLDINGSVTENPTFKEYAGSSSLVFVAESSNRYKNSGSWKITNAGSSNTANSSSSNPTETANNTGCSMDKGGKEIPINWVNKTGSELRFEWVNFDCEPVNYATVQPGGTFKQDSFNGHVWRISYYAKESDEPRWVELKKVTLSPSNKSMNITLD